MTENIQTRLRHRTEYLPHAGMMKLLEEAAAVIDRLEKQCEELAHTAFVLETEINKLRVAFLILKEKCDAV